MDPSSVHHHHHHHHQQEMSSQTLESMLVCTKPEQEKKPRPAEQQPQKCPRCDSSNTKFCYYNNYSLTQPRYFCKSCRRYWTKGGTLRNVPVGGGCRKNKRSSISTSRRSSSSISQDHNNIPISSYDHHHPSTNLFASLQKQAATIRQLGGIDHQEQDCVNNMPILYNSGNCSSFLDALRGGFLESSPNAFHHNMYYGGNIGANTEEMGMNYDQEMRNTVRYQDENNNNNNTNSKSFGGAFPWQQMNGDSHVNMNMNNIMGDFESTNRQNWNGFGGSTNWHGIINSPLM